MMMLMMLMAMMCHMKDGSDERTNKHAASSSDSHGADSTNSLTVSLLGPVPGGRRGQRERKCVCMCVCVYVCVYMCVWCVVYARAVSPSPPITPSSAGLMCTLLPFTAAPHVHPAQRTHIHTHK